MRCVANAEATLVPMLRTASPPLGAKQEFRQSTRARRLANVIENDDQASTVTVWLPDTHWQSSDDGSVLAA